MTENELTHLLYELLSPKKNSEYGQLYLNLFIINVLRLNVTEDELMNAEVYYQYKTHLIGYTRYIDLVIITRRRLIPIEVKLDAEDQPYQCYDYWREAERYMAKKNPYELPVLYYLTPSGGFPDIHSTIDLTHVDIDVISFRLEILCWLEDCLERTPENFSCHWKLIRLRKEIDKISSSSHYAQFEEIIQKFFTELDERFDDIFCRRYHLKRGNNERGEVGDFQNYRREIYKFYSKSFSTPGITFLCTNTVGNVIKLGRNKELWFRVECRNRGSYELCAGFIIFNRNTMNCLCSKTDITRLLGGKNILSQSLVDGYSDNFNGMVGMTILHDEQNNSIDFKFKFDNKWLRLENKIELCVSIANVITELEKLLDNFNRYL